mmetsp:Transcript_23908/g.49823  ORF Transcript_23908/g.49823 Transcript_23908/m.49823 type:complete len:453 (+) Transcript_23908:124-1482(+)
MKKSRRHRGPATMKRSKNNVFSDSSSSTEPSPDLNPLSYAMDSNLDEDSDAFSVNALRDTIIAGMTNSSATTTAYPRHASASRQLPPNPPDTANRSLARKVEEVKAKLQRERNKSEHLQSLLDQSASLSDDNKKLRLQIKELQYNLKKQASEKATLESQTTSINKRTKSSLNGMRAAIMTVEEVVKSRNRRTFTSISNLESALKSFRRLLKGGYDTIPSYSAFKLLDDMDTKIGDVRVALEVGTEGLSKIAGEVSRREAAVNREDDTMIEVLEEVERRNRELGRELGREKKEREERREEGERMARLLSEYRLEIIRSKDAEERALHDLARERDTVDALRKRLDLAVEALRDAERSRLDHPPPPPAPTPMTSATPQDPNPPLPHASLSPPRQSSSTPPTTPSLSADEEMFTRLLQASNDKLLSDLREEVEKKLERVVLGETKIIEAASSTPIK